MPKKAVTNVRHLKYREVLEEGSERRAFFLSPARLEAIAIGRENQLKIQREKCETKGETSLEKPAKRHNKPQKSQKEQTKRTANQQTENRKGFRQHAEVHVKINYKRKEAPYAPATREENHVAERGTDHIIHSRSALHSAENTFAHR